MCIKSYWSSEFTKRIKDPSPPQEIKPNKKDHEHKEKDSLNYTIQFVKYAIIWNAIANVMCWQDVIS